jgi:hypothetical protein
LVAANAATEERDRAAQTASVKGTPHEAARTEPATEEFPAERIGMVAGG